MEESYLGQRAVRLAWVKELACVKTLEIGIRNGEPCYVPRVFLLLVGGTVYHVGIYPLVAEVVVEVSRTAGILVEAIVLGVAIAGVVVYPHLATVVVLVDTLGTQTGIEVEGHAIVGRDAVDEFYVVFGLFATQLEAVGITQIDILGKGTFILRAALTLGGDGCALALKLLEPRFVSLVASVSLHVVIARTVVVAHAVFYHSRPVAARDVLEEVPAVVGIVPCSATVVGIAATSILLVGKAVGIASEVGCRESAELIVEVVVGVAVEDKVAVSALHLHACVTMTIDVEVLELAV